MRYFTDPHLDLRRTTNTTAASQALLKERLRAQARRCVEGDEKVVCLGDLFDRYSNPEAVVAEGLRLVHRTELTLPGNHDIANRADAVGSLQLIREVLPEKVPMTPFGEAGIDQRVIDGVPVVSIPHVASQDLFRQSLQMAYDAVRNPDGHLLLLHCNFDNDMTEGHEASLNLALDDAQDLLERFAYILIGHEHVPRAALGGRVQILGNTMPLAFGEVADRFLWRYTPAEGLTKERIWSEAESFRVVDLRELLLAGGDLRLEGVEMVDVRGEVALDECPELAKCLQKLWKVNPELLMVRDGKQVAGVEQREAVPFARLDLPSLIARELAGTPMEALWNEWAA